MKIRILSMIGVAAMVIPAAAQQKNSAPTIEANAAPHVEIPEGAFEIAIPNLGTFGPDSEQLEVLTLDTSMTLDEGRVHVRIISAAPRGTTDPTLIELAGSDGRIAIATIGDGAKRERIIIVGADTVGMDNPNGGQGPYRLGPTRQTFRTSKRLRGTTVVGIGTGREQQASLAPSFTHVVVVDRSDAPGPGTVSADHAEPAAAVAPEVATDNARNQPQLPSAADMLDASNAGYSLTGATPNPTAEVATIGFTLPRAGRTKLEVFDNAGRIVATLADEELGAGAHTRRFDAGGLPAGLYLCRLSSGSYADTKTITVAR